MANNVTRAASHKGDFCPTPRKGAFQPNARNLPAELAAVPTIIATAGEKARRRFLEFFAGTIRNPNTRDAYARATRDFFDWCDAHGIRDLGTIEPLMVATYIEQLTGLRAAPTVKQHLAAIRMLFDWLVIGQVIARNPASSVRGPRHVVRRGKTPVLSVEETRQLLNGIAITRVVGKTKAGEEIREPHVVGLRDRALIAVMVYSFARVSAVTAMKVRDYYSQGRRAWLRLHEKGGKRHEVPAHHKAEEYLDAYISAAGIADEKNAPLFRTTRGKTRELTRHPLTRTDVLRMIQRRAADVKLSTAVCCHSFRATGITAYLENGGTLEHAQQIAAHESPRTTKLYDRTSDEITLDEIERIAI
jgi:integrase/recombinase XerD